MFTLFIDTHGEIITVALFDGQKLLIKTKESQYSHAVYLAPMIRDILKENHLSVKSIKDIVAVNGPGSFTGLRIGLSNAKTLAYSLKIPIYLVSSLSSYLVSSEVLNDKFCVLEDNKGYYVSGFDKDNNVILEENYVSDVSKYDDKFLVPLELNVVNVIEYARKSAPVDAHLVRANYVKRIEVEKW